MNWRPAEWRNDYKQDNVPNHLKVDFQTWANVFELGADRMLEAITKELEGRNLPEAEVERIMQIDTNVLLNAQMVAQAQLNRILRTLEGKSREGEKCTSFRELAEDFRGAMSYRELGEEE